ncbi:hypothetical protein TGAMA5MH_05228 [Trichoderma gamsii]|uniref:Uncharacterized protein n=1 Tax=Trichoderma gamsii TaxID=398673 RepID=A0A2K0TAE2_9HYPO|nr:hypothetical protein TGAMA5MH_05228 [Trichoderma gamsii]
MQALQELFSCLCGSFEPASDFYSEQKQSTSALLSPTYDPIACTHEKVAVDVVSVLLRSEKHGKDLRKQLDETVGTLGWSEMLAKRVLNALVGAIREGRDKMGPAFTKAYDDAAKEADSVFHQLVEDAKNHPLELVATVLITVIAIGVLVALAPSVLELLGFGELGPVAGTFASWWESTYAGYIPAGSMFSFFQRLGMIWMRA